MLCYLCFIWLILIDTISMVHGVRQLGHHHHHPPLDHQYGHCGQNGLRIPPTGPATSGHTFRLITCNCKKRTSDIPDDSFRTINLTLAVLWLHDSRSSDGPFGSLPSLFCWPFSCPACHVVSCHQTVLVAALRPRTGTPPMLDKYTTHTHTSLVVQPKGRKNGKQNATSRVEKHKKKKQK